MPAIVGSEVLLEAAGAAVATAVWAEDAVAEPALFVAVTETRNVEPTSAATTVYDCDVAPLTLVQLFPLVSQRRH